MGTGFAKKKKQAKMLQEQFSKMQDQLKNQKYTGTAPNDLVSVTINGEYEVIKVAIKPECVDPEDVEGLEDLVKAALTDAVAQAKKGSGDVGIPNLSSLGL